MVRRKWSASGSEKRGVSLCLLLQEARSRHLEALPRKTLSVSAFSVLQCCFTTHWPGDSNALVKSPREREKEGERETRLACATHSSGTPFSKGNLDRERDPRDRPTFQSGRWRRRSLFKPVAWRAVAPTREAWTTPKGGPPRVRQRRVLLILPSGFRPAF